MRDAVFKVWRWYHHRQSKDCSQSSTTSEVPSVYLRSGKAVNHSFGMILATAIAHCIGKTDLEEHFLK